MFAREPSASEPRERASATGTSPALLCHDTILKAVIQTQARRPRGAVRTPARAMSPTPAAVTGVGSGTMVKLFCLKPNSALMYERCSLSVICRQRLVKPAGDANKRGQHVRKALQMTPGFSSSSLRGLPTELIGSPIQAPAHSVVLQEHINRFT